jgi:antirestriction protein
MVRIQVHEDLLYNKKLRRLMKYLDCSQCEAIGILGFLWLFAVHTADETGIIECIGPEDIYRPGEERPYTSEQVTEVLIKVGFLEHGKEQDSYVIHDWDEWQGVWIEEKERRAKHAAYMREQRERERQDK